MNARTIRANGVDLCVDAMGDARDPAILLISGAAASMDWWEDDFCRRLADGRRFVVRYDNRDTGRSATYEPGAPPYSVADLENDAVAILDALGISSAHLVGISMGGLLAQRVAVHYPDRVDSLTLISTSPGGPGGPNNTDLPPIDDDLAAHLRSDSATPDWTDRNAVINHLLASQRQLMAPWRFDQAHQAALAGRVFDRSRDMSAATNHYIMDDADPVRDRLGEIGVPTLVIHGTADPLFPFGHAEALVQEIPGARLLPLKGGGHEMPPAAVWPQVIPALLRLTSGGWEEQADRLASVSVAADDPAGWFERLYGAAVSGEVEMPWDRSEPQPLLVQWAHSADLSPAGRRAVVVGCGLGADAEYVAGLGFITVAFDIAQSAVSVARQRHLASSVEYVVADLLDRPRAWCMAFDLVIEIYTVQALPATVRAEAIHSVRSLVAPGGGLVVIAFAGISGGAQVAGPPWPLTRQEIDSFGTDGLSPRRIEEITDPDRPGVTRWLAEFSRPTGRDVHSTGSRPDPGLAR